MYLVLTAMLALNVSAEIMNTFLDLDTSLERSNKLTDVSIDATYDAIQPVLDKKNPALKKAINSGIASVRASTKELSTLISEYRTLMIDDAGNKDGIDNDQDYDMEKNQPIGMKNKDVAERIMLHTKDGAESRASILKAKINETATKMVEAYTLAMKAAQPEAQLKDAEVAANIESFKNNISLAVTDDWKLRAKEGTPSWEKYKFGHMPLAAVLPILRKIEADAKNAEASAVNDLAKLAGGREIKLDEFFPVMNAKKGYIIQGEKFEADVYMGAYSKELTGVSLKVNGVKLKVGSDGKAKFSETASKIGEKTLNLEVSVTNPITGKTKTGKDKFVYEVGVRSANVTADKMNVFYIGVDNPISVVVAGVASRSVKVNGTGCTVSPKGTGKYNVTASRPGEAKIMVSAGKDFPPTPYVFRVKRIPDPFPQLGGGKNKRGGVMGSGEFKAQLGLAAVLGDDFDFDAKCRMMGFEITKVAKRQDAISKANNGAKYSSDVKRMVRSAKPGDTYYFDKIKAKCPGDNTGRQLSSVVFKIK